MSLPSDDPTLDSSPPPRSDDDDDTGLFPVDADDGEETSLFDPPRGPVPSGDSTCLGDSAGPEGRTGLGQSTFADETQILQTQVASREELEAMRGLYERRRRRRVATRLSLLVAAALVAVGLSVYVSTRDPEKFLEMPDPKASTTLLPALAPDSLRPGISGSVGLSYPSNGVQVLRSAAGVFEAVVRIGHRGDVPVRLVFEAYEDTAALSEDRDASFRRYLESSPSMVVALDGMVTLPDEDFFGGRGGLLRGIPCSRREYRCLREGITVYGVVSFFRSGSLCCAFRREVAAAESERASRQMEPTYAWLWADRSGAFAAAQWEGAPGIGCDDPARELARCRGRLAVESPAEWSGIEAGLRDILVSADAESREAARRLLVELRSRKALHWKQLVARRMPFAASEAPGSPPVPAAAALDTAVRRDFDDPSEEWYFLAHRKEWWK